MTEHAPLRQSETADWQAVDEQIRLCTALEKALKSRARLTVQAMPTGCEIIDCESGDLLQTIRLVEILADDGMKESFRHRVLRGLRRGPRG